MRVNNIQSASQRSAPMANTKQERDWANTPTRADCSAMQEHQHQCGSRISVFMCHNKSHARMFLAVPVKRTRQTRISHLTSLLNRPACELCCIRVKAGPRHSHSGLIQRVRIFSGFKWGPSAQTRVMHDHLSDRWRKGDTLSLQRVLLKSSYWTATRQSLWC